MKKFLIRGALAVWLAVFAPHAFAKTATVHSSFDLQVPVAPTPVNVTGATWLTYELHLRSFSQDQLMLQSVEVLADDDSVLAELREDEP